MSCTECGTELGGRRLHWMARALRMSVRTLTAMQRQSSFQKLMLMLSYSSRWPQVLMLSYSSQWPQVLLTDPQAGLGYDCVIACVLCDCIM